jgi:hypothetical protein
MTLKSCRFAAFVSSLAAILVASGCSYEKSPSMTAPTRLEEASGGGAPAVSANRTPDPEEGTRLPLPNMSGLIARMASEHQDTFRNSCQDQGGSWEFMDLVVDELRRQDTRWGYNWKRGNAGDPSKDVVDYHWGRGDDEGSTEVYIIDVIGGHCGGNPTPIWNDVTDVTFNSGTVGRWTGRGRF